MLHATVYIKPNNISHDKLFKNTLAYHSADITNNVIAAVILTKNCYAIKYNSINTRKTKIKHNLCNTVTTFITKKHFETFVIARSQPVLYLNQIPASISLKKCELESNRTFAKSTHKYVGSCKQISNSVKTMCLLEVYRQHMKVGLCCRAKLVLRCTL